MTGIDGSTTASLQDRSQNLDAPCPDVWTAFEAEFVVEWQVPERTAFPGPSGGLEVNPL